MKKNLNFIIAFLTLLFVGCNNPSEKHLELEAAQASLESNLEMYTMVWNEVFKNKNLDIINEEYFDKDVDAVATSAGDVVGLENFKAYYGNYITGFSDGELIFVDLLVKVIKWLNIGDLKALMTEISLVFHQLIKQ